MATGLGHTQRARDGTGERMLNSKTLLQLMPSVRQTKQKDAGREHSGLLLHGLVDLRF